MNFEPQKFFIGLVDFFSILLPGALLTYMLKDAVGPGLLGDRYYQLVGTQAWVAFLFSSYLFGHFVFLLGSRLLDDLAYDKIRAATYAQQIKRLADGKKLSSGFARWLAKRQIKSYANEAVNQAVIIKDFYLNPLGASSTINVFQWCKTILNLEHPEALATVQRFEADSKFFRSLFVVLCFVLLWGAITNQPVLIYVSIPMLLLAFWRYVDQRSKATNQAYWYIITLEGNKENGFRLSSDTKVGELSHAGGVVFKRSGKQIEYLLVQAKKAPNEWVVPKGHIEPGEPMQETAVREVREEAGVWARIKDELKSISITVNNKQIHIQFYLMEALKEYKPKEQRKHEWMELNEALDRATHEETKDLLRLAEQKSSST